MIFAGFEAIDDSNYTSDVGWGCMLRSSQMLVAQVCCCYFVSVTLLRVLIPFRESQV